MCSRERNASQCLHALGDSVGEFALLARMLVIEQVQLIERRAAHLPMVLLVEIAQRYCVHEKLVESFNALPAHVLCKRDRRRPNLAESLDRMVLCVPGLSHRFLRDHGMSPC